MNPTTYARLVTAMSKIIDQENNERDAYVYEDLNRDMATAARLVYDSCLKAGRFTEENGLPTVANRGGVK